MWRFVLILTLCAGMMTACDSGGGDTVELPTRVVIAEPTDTDTPIPAPPTDTAIAPTAEADEVAQATPDTITATPSIEPTDGPSVTPSSTITDTPSPTFTLTPVPTLTPTETVEPQAIGFLAELALQVTIEIPPFVPSPTSPVVAGAPQVPGAPAPGTTCPNPPPGIFASVLALDPTVTNSIGCPVGQPPQTIQRNSAVQAFERGLMLWLDDSPGTIYVLYDDGSLGVFNDTFDASIDPESGGQTPPEGRIEPIRGFGKVWRENVAVQSGLGWAISPESGDFATLGEFAQGRMIYVPSQGVIYVIAPVVGAWGSVPT